jgi:MtN3 and saliva related transmembrane protein
LGWLYNNIEIVGFIAALLGTCSLVPQVIKILKSKSTVSISLIMYIIIAIDSILWLIYGLTLSLHPLIVQSCITGCCAFIVIITKLLWG